jgi:hypothetical protein
VTELVRTNACRKAVPDSEIDESTRAYCVPLGGAPMSTDLSELDLTKWKPAHEDPHLRAALKAKGVPIS